MPASGDLCFSSLCSMKSGSMKSDSDEEEDEEELLRLSNPSLGQSYLL